MTRYSPIIGYLLAWQLLMPVICFFATATWWIAAATAIIFISLLISKDWERNSYSVYSAVSVVVISLVLAISRFIAPTASIVNFVILLWIYAQIAFTATSPYPLRIRMPLIIYTLTFICMIPSVSSPFIVIPVALIFSLVMGYFAKEWRAKSISLTIRTGPAEPPYSFSLATAIVTAVGINLCLTVAEYAISSSVPRVVSMLLLFLICAWLICTRDWKKNALAVTALVLMMTLHTITITSQVLHNHYLRILAIILSVSPVMFHTTAPVFRGMRIVITLFAVYTALNKQALIDALSASPLTLWQQHATIILIDALALLTLLLMALHWRHNMSQ